MEAHISSLAGKAYAWLMALMTVGSLIQFALVVVALVLAWMVNNRWHNYIQSSLGEEAGVTMRTLAMRSSQRLVLPLVMLGLVILFKAILNAVDAQVWLLKIVIPLLLSLALIRLLVFLLRRAYSPSSLLRAWESIISTSIWVVVALHLLGVLPDIKALLDDFAVNIGDKRVSLLDVIMVTLSVGLFLLVASMLSRMLERRVMRSRHLGISMRMALSKTIKIVLLSLAVLIALNSVGVDLTVLTVFGGALGVGLGLGLQRITSNFVSGMILLYDRSIRPGDVITIGQRFGWVQELRARYVVVRDRDGVETLIPNENLITSEVTSWSHTDRAVRIKVPVQISYHDDPEEAMAVMLKACEHPRVLDEPPIAARLISFGDSGINMEARAWIQDPEGGIGGVRSDINLAIWKGFREAGITIPFPQRDVHVIQPLAETLE
ncbi:MAG: mechanosensitive ion channel [Gammaproteobacteria bacterium]|nr:MAG: mechanosensitive ion channel [Gammaproteobacteria bacterium]